MIRVWTDGACKGNPGPGGWAWAEADGAWARGYEAESTNQRMEIKAAFEAMTRHDGEVTIVSDSTYVVNCFRDRWWEGWLKRGWKNSQKKPVANRDLWEPFVDAYRQRSSEVFFEWVKGHSGDPMNDLVDRLAVQSSHDGLDVAGDAPPDDLGPADTAGASTGSRDKRLPPGVLCGVFGLRPPDLGGYDPNPTADRVRGRLQEVIAAKAELHRGLHVVSGLRLGAEMLGAEAAIAAGVPLVAVLPFPNADAKWGRDSRATFTRLREAAVAEILLERKEPDTPAKVGGSLKRRDAWLARNLDEAIVVWDGKEKFVGQLRKTLVDRLGDEVWDEAP